MAQIADGSFFEQVSAAFKADDPNVADKQREAAHVRCIQLVFHAIARGAFEEVFELTTEDFSLEIFGPPTIPFNGSWQGRDDVLAAMQRNFAMVDEQQPTIQSVTAQGDFVVVIARESGRITATGKFYDVHWVQEFFFQNGRLRRVREIVDGAANIESREP